MSCNKIPSRIMQADYAGDYSVYQNAVYQLYLKTFSEKQFYYNGKPIHEKLQPKVSGMSCTFWHIVSSGADEEHKLPDFNRYETVAWPGFILEYCLSNCSSVLQWKNTRSTTKRIAKRVLLFCPEIDYLVVLEEREDYYLFWTAYPVNHEHVRNKLMKE